MAEDLKNIPDDDFINQCKKISESMGGGLVAFFDELISRYEGAPIKRMVSITDDKPPLNQSVICYLPPARTTKDKPRPGRFLIGHLFEIQPNDRAGYIDQDILFDNAFNLAEGGIFWAFPYICHQNFVSHWCYFPKDFKL